MTTIKRYLAQILAVGCLAACVPDAARAQTQAITDSVHADGLPMDRGQLGSSTATMKLTSGNLEIVFVPLDERILRLLAKDSYRSFEQILHEHRRSIDSVMSTLGLSSPGIAFVSFHALAANTRFDPGLLTVSFHGQQFTPAGWIPMSTNFSNQQLDLREQVQALFLYRRDLPVREGFTISYLNATSDDWQSRLVRFDAERARILGTMRTRPDSVRR